MFRTLQAILRSEVLISVGAFYRCLSGESPHRSSRYHRLHSERRARSVRPWFLPHAVWFDKSRGECFHSCQHERFRLRYEQRD